MRTKGGLDPLGCAGAGGGGQRPASPWLRSEPSPPATPGCLLVLANPELLLGRWDGGQGPPGPASPVTWPPRPFVPSQQGREMGPPPAPPSAPAPAGTTAVPRLIPDLVARIPCESRDLQEVCGGGPAGGRQLLPPDATQACLFAPPPGPRWALVATAVVVGVLVISCLLCVICCCHRGRHRKKPRDKEAVGLGSARGTTTTHLVRSRHAAQAPRLGERSAAGRGAVDKGGGGPGHGNHRGSGGGGGGRGGAGTRAWPRVRALWLPGLEV